MSVAKAGIQPADRTLREYLRIGGKGRWVCAGCGGLFQIDDEKPELPYSVPPAGGRGGRMRLVCGEACGVVVRLQR